MTKQEMQVLVEFYLENANFLNTFNFAMVAPGFFLVDVLYAFLSYCCSIPCNSMPFMGCSVLQFRFAWFESQLRSDPHLQKNCFICFNGSPLTHFSPRSNFYTPWQHQKIYDFLIFSGGIEMWDGTEMG